MATTGPGAVGTRPPWRRWLLAALPWAAAAALAAAGIAATRGAGGEPTAVLAGPPASPAVEAPAAGPAPTGAAPTTDLPAPLELAVLAAARATLGTAGLADAAGPADDRWPLDVRVAGVTDLGDGVAVVEVHALVIEHTDGSWQPPTARAAAVPVRLDAPGVVLGAAWPLAPPALPRQAPTGTELDEPDPAVVAALEAAGWEVQEVTSVEVVLGEHLRVGLRGAPPDDDSLARHTVWLRDDPGGPRPLVPTDDQPETP